MSMFSHSPDAVILNALGQLGNSLVSLGNNQGLLDIVRSEMTMAGTSLNSMVSAAQSFQKTNILTGEGPVSTGLLAAAEWLDVKTTKNLNNLAVFSPVKPSEYDLSKCHQNWSSFFISKFPRTLFDDQGIVSIQLSHLGYEITITVTADKNPKYTEDEMVPVDSISYTMNPPEKFWTITGTISSRECLFNRMTFANTNVNIMHHVEQVGFTTPVSSSENYMWFVDHCLMRPINEHFNFTPATYDESGRTGYNDNLEYMFDTLVRELPKEHRSAAYSLLFSNIPRRSPLPIIVEGVEGLSLNIVRGHSDWDTLEDVTQSRMKHAWNRDTPVIKCQSVSYNGIDLGNRFMPQEWTDLISAQISKTLSQILAKREWPESNVETEPSQ